MRAALRRKSRGPLSLVLRMSLQGKLGNMVKGHAGQLQEAEDMKVTLLSSLVWNQPGRMEAGVYP